MQATTTRPSRSKRNPMRTVALGWLVTGLVTGSACTADEDSVRPPVGELFFPTGIVVAESAGVAFVTNANSELRWDSGSIAVLDLDTIDRVAADWVAAGATPGGCEPDLDRGETLTCDEAMFVRADAGVRIGNFATDVALQTLDGNALRVVVPTRGDPSITWADWDGERLSCTASREANAVCDDAHRLSFVFNDDDVASIPEEPFGVMADSEGEFIMVTHFGWRVDAVTLIDSPKSPTDSRPVQVTDVVAQLFAPDPLTGHRGASGIAGRNGPGDLVYVGSRTEDRVQTFSVGRPVNNAPPYFIPGEHFFLHAVGAAHGGATDTRGMAFSADGERLYMVNRRPPALIVYDTAAGPTGAPTNLPLGATDICRQASTVAVSGLGADERAYVTCFQDGQLQVVDATGRIDVEEAIVVGRGPYGVATSRIRNKLYVTNFLEDTVAVIDIEPGSTRRNRVVLRVGIPRAL